jgi:hypothetical protein
MGNVAQREKVYKMCAVNVIEIVKSSAVMMNAVGCSMNSIMDEMVMLYEGLNGRPCMGLESEWVRALVVTAVNTTDNVRNTDDMPTPRP